jgi:hypothetical protein
MKIRPKYGSARLRMSTMGEFLFLDFFSPGWDVGRISGRKD